MSKLRPVRPINGSVIQFPMHGSATLRSNSLVDIHKYSPRISVLSQVRAREAHVDRRVPAIDHPAIAIEDYMPVFEKRGFHNPPSQAAALQSRRSLGVRKTDVRPTTYSTAYSSSSITRNRRTSTTSAIPQKSYPKDPAPIFCWVCGDQLGAESWISGHPARFAFEVKKCQLAWERHRRDRKYYRDMFGIHLAASELDKPFRCTELFRDLFRLILVIKDDQNRPKEYSISGIAQLQGARSGGKHLLVPPRRTRACLGAPEEPPSDWPVGEARVFRRKAAVAAIPVPHPFSDLKPEAGRLEGYVVHSRCWTLMEKHLGSQAIARLDLVVSALQEQWSLLIDRLEHQPADSLGLYGAFARYQGWVYPGPADCDPLHIPEIRNIFRQSVSSRTRQKKKDLANGTVRRLFTKYGVPPEIILLIAEHLEVTDARNMEIAFGEQLPVHYWRKRILDIYVEVDDVNPDRVDWGYLAVGWI